MYGSEKVKDSMNTFWHDRAVDTVAIALKG